MIKQIEFEIPQMRRGFHLITNEIIKNTGNLPEKGLIHIMLKHTSAAICINENADPDVRTDLQAFMNKLVPDGDAIYEHFLEGPDDMPAHIKSSLLGQTLTIPVSNHKLNLGTWQGIYLCEFRNNGGARSLVITILE